MDDSDAFPMLELYQQEAESHTDALNEGILKLESDRQSEHIEALMRAAHSLKGAAHIIGLNSVAQVAHSLEDVFVLAQQDSDVPSQAHFDVLLSATDYLATSGQQTKASMASWLKDSKPKAEALTEKLQQICSKENCISAKQSSDSPQAPAEKGKKTIKSSAADPKTSGTKPPQHEAVDALESTVKVKSKNLNQLMELSAEALVQSGKFKNFRNQLLRLKVMQAQVQATPQLQKNLGQQAQKLHNIIEDFDTIAAKQTFSLEQIHHELFQSRMRPFGDITKNFPRLIRDLARQLDKKIKIEIEGESVPVDRDILEKLESPLNHLLRNACDHGIESPLKRVQNKKSEAGTITLKAYHQSGELIVEVLDDGAGIKLEALRSKVVERKLLEDGIAQSLNKQELLEFLFLPGFSTARKLTDVSGRGVGLDVVQTLMREIGGDVKIQSWAQKGTRFRLRAPITQSMERVLIVEIHAELYAFTLSGVDAVLRVKQKDIQIIEGRQHINYKDQNIALISAGGALGIVAESSSIADPVHTIVLQENKHFYGLVVSAVSGEADLAIRALNPRLGKIPGLKAAAINLSGEIVLLVDTQSLLASMGKLIDGNIPKQIMPEESHTQKSILVVDDSTTVRETQRKLLEEAGYAVRLACDGLEGWETLHQEHFDLVITDLDMPRLDGYGLISKIRNSRKFRQLPIIIVSYKDRREDHLKGLELGANSYLTKSSFQGKSFLSTVQKLTKN